MSILLTDFGAASANIVMLFGANAMLRRILPGSMQVLHPLNVAAASCAAAYVAAYSTGMPDLEAAKYILIGACVAASVVSDVYSGLVLDALTISSLAGALVLAGAGGTLLQSIEGAAAGGGAIGVMYLASLGRGIGLGDAKLAACIGSAFGPARTILALGAAFVIGGAFAAVVILSRRGGRKMSVPFAPFLAFGAAAALAVPL